MRADSGNTAGLRCEAIRFQLRRKAYVGVVSVDSSVGAIARSQVDRSYLLNTDLDQFRPSAFCPNTGQAVNYPSSALITQHQSHIIGQNVYVHIMMLICKRVCAFFC